MTIYTDYEGFKNQYDDFITFLLKNNSKIIFGFKHILLVVDYLYEKQKSVPNSEEETDIFQTGYAYLFDRFNSLDLICTQCFNSDFKEMDKFSDTIILLLYIFDFQDEIKTIDENESEFTEQFISFEEELFKTLEDKKHIDKSYNLRLNTLSIECFEKLDNEYYGINDIFYDIALEFNLEDECDGELIDIFNPNND